MDLSYIENRLVELMCDKANKIYVLKGFNSIITKLKIDLYHIFDLGLIHTLNIIDSLNNDCIKNWLSLLSTQKSCFCLYEEILYVEHKKLLGLASGYGYSIEIIDIGCFNIHYPGIRTKYYQPIIDSFQSEQNDNLIQVFYADYTVDKNNNVIIYNVLDDENSYVHHNLIDRYEENVFAIYDYQQEKPKEIDDNFQSETLVELFNATIDGLYNKLIINVTGKDINPMAVKILHLLNNMKIVIEIRKKEKVYEKPDLYNTYLEILQRKNKDWKFKDISIYKDPFSSNDKIKISQCIIIDTIYQNICKAYCNKACKDIFVTAPTGAGKSILFQIPAILAAERKNLLTIVISPLIALMNDQVENIKVLTDKAATINSEYTPRDKDKIKDMIKDGSCSILYISPETLLSNNDIKSFIGERKIGLIVVDEAHTVATWGKSFRPDYWYLGDYLYNLRHSGGYSFPIATFTATATIGNNNDDMYHDIVESLHMADVPYFGDVKRNNIQFDIVIKNANHDYVEEKKATVLKRINGYLSSGEKTLAYFPYVKQLNEIYDELNNNKVGKYHGKLDKSIKNETVDDLRIGEKIVILATKAFGMGVDIEGIKNVYHYAPTGNLSDYVQEIGRAARDPKMIGVAATDYYEKDLDYIRKLYGLSAITNNNVKGVLFMKSINMLTKEIFWFLQKNLHIYSMLSKMMS